MSDGELNDGELNDGELNDGALGRELSALTPEPAADYWTRIDAMLADVEAERRGDPTAAVGEEFQLADHADTDDNVVRLTDMNQPRDLVNRFNRRSGLVLAAAASLVVLLAVAGLLVLRDDSTNIDATTTDDTTTESTPSPDEGTTNMTSASDDGSGESEAAAPITATHCFYQDDTELLRGEQAVRLVVRTDGTAVAVERDQRPDGEATIIESTGFVLDEAERTFAMMADLGGQVYTRIWRISDGGLSTDIESFVTNGDCDDVDRALDGIAMPQPVAHDPDSIDPALDPGTYCWRGDGFIRGVYRLTVGDDGTVTVAAYSTISVNDPVISMIETGTGIFATANEIAFNVERWTPEGITADSNLYTINGDDLQPTIYPEPAPQVDCDALDEWRLPTEGLNISTDEELTFEPGTSGTTVEGGFVLGELAVYRVEAEEGQTMTVTISSPEDNAAVTVYNPERLPILDNEDGSGSSSLVLPESGVYQIVVSGIRGNVSYTLDVDIR